MAVQGAWELRWPSVAALWECWWARSLAGCASAWGCAWPWPLAAASRLLAPYRRWSRWPWAAVAPRPRWVPDTTAPAARSPSRGRTPRTRRGSDQAMPTARAQYRAGSPASAVALSRHLALGQAGDALQPCAAPSHHSAIGGEDSDLARACQPVKRRRSISAIASSCRRRLPPRQCPPVWATAGGSRSPARRRPPRAAAPPRRTPAPAAAPPPAAPR